MDKGKVQNPLTIIAIFAGIAEVTGTTVLLGLPLEIQRIFVWFAMTFPILLVTAFFIVLYKKRDALYAPSDYKDEKYFIDLLNDNKQTIKEVNDLIKDAKELTVSVEEKNPESESVKVFNTLQNKLTEIEEKIEKSNANTADLFGGITVRRPELYDISLKILDLLKGTLGGLTYAEINQRLGGIFALNMYLSQLIEKEMIFEKDNKYYYKIRYIGA
ncbi:hypothetical protein [Paenibacillus odorifer]|uniref:hypothetical protein n=1 Tax=Paenibacillus odorifer TaxID=189426 RepID=UPI00158E11B1|nr:hypothetical protein [Paenibacillus odorifer]